MDATWKPLADFLQAGALVALAGLLATGTLIPRIIVERLILTPRDERIAALERAMAKRDEEVRHLLTQQAAALEAQTKLIDRLTAERGGG